MTRNLRRAHRIGTLALAILVPPLVAAAILARRPVPPVTTIPPSLIVDVDALRSELGFIGEAIAPGVRWRLAPASGSIEETVEFAIDQDPRIPDLLVYWSLGDTPTAGGPLVGESYLLGRVADRGVRRFELPNAARGRAGSLVLFSLARNEVVAASRGPVPLAERP